MDEYWFHLLLAKRRMRPIFFLLATMATLLAIPDTAQAEIRRSPLNSAFGDRQNPYQARREKLRPAKVVRSPAVEALALSATPPAPAPVTPAIIPAVRQTADAPPAKPPTIYVPNLQNFKGAREPLAPATAASVTVLDQQLALNAPTPSAPAAPAPHTKKSARAAKSTPPQTYPGAGVLTLPSAVAKLVPAPAAPVAVAQAPTPPAPPKEETKIAAVTPPPAPPVPTPPTEAAPVILQRETAVIAPAPVAPAEMQVAAATPAPAAAPAAPVKQLVAQTPDPLIYVKRSSVDLTKQQEAQEAALAASTLQAQMSTELLAALSPAAGEAPTPTMPPEAMPAPPSEPAAELSTATKKQLKAIPSKIDSPKGKAKEKITLDKIDGEEEIPGKPVRATAEAMGLKIDVRKPAFEANTSLERAYNALSIGDTEGAAEMYRDVLVNDPNNEDALFSLATIYQRAGAIDKARPLYQKLLKINPRHREGLNNFLGLAADEAPEEALRQLEALQQRNPDFSAIPAQMAMIYQKLGLPDLAIEKMSHAVSLAPENVTYRYNLAILFDRRGRREEAQKLYQLLVEAAMSGEKLPGDVRQIQERLVFLRSNRAS